MGCADVGWIGKPGLCNAKISLDLNGGENEGEGNEGGVVGQVSFEQPANE